MIEKNWVEHEEAEEGKSSNKDLNCWLFDSSPSQPHQQICVCYQNSDSKVPLPRRSRWFCHCKVGTVSNVVYVVCGVRAVHVGCMRGTVCSAYSSCVCWRMFFWKIHIFAVLQNWSVWNRIYHATFRDLATLQPGIGHKLKKYFWCIANFAW